MNYDVPPALASSALYSKSQLYIQRALVRQVSDETDEYQLWASLALELLGKSALSSIHPSLIADPLHYQSLFAASGVTVSTDIKTITAKTLFERLQHLVKPFDAKVKDFCNQVANRRNAELHSGDAPFAATRAEKWDAEYWYAVDLILTFQGQTFESWLGTDDAAMPKDIVAKAKQAKLQLVNVRIQRTAEVFKKLKKRAKQKALRDAELKAFDDYPRLFEHYWDASWEAECPSCTAKAFVVGELDYEDVIQTQGDEYGVWETVQRVYSGSVFRCPTCGLKLDGYDELTLAELPLEHSDTDERQMEYEPQYGND
ncbi:MAG TPA: hypothetical protein DCX06_02710 [Opitutae bacterium]|nr:hypothetical protein [Opitutae bacterium]